MPDADVVVTSRAPVGCPVCFAVSRQYATANRVGAMVPRRCTRMTASHSCSDIVAMVRSRRIPALLMRTSRPPKAAMAWSMSRLAPSQSETSSVLATAWPPAAVIRGTGPAQIPRTAVLLGLWGTGNVPGSAGRRWREALTQHAALHLARLRAGEIGDELDPARPLERGQALAAVGEQASGQL